MSFEVIKTETYSSYVVVRTDAGDVTLADIIDYFHAAGWDDFARIKFCLPGDHHLVRFEYVKPQ